MKRIQKIVLSQLAKDSLTEREEAQLMGGTYCYLGPASENQAYNEAEGKCSCICEAGEDYYSDSIVGLRDAASTTKAW